MIDGLPLPGAAASCIRRTILFASSRISKNSTAIDGTCSAWINKLDQTSAMPEVMDSRDRDFTIGRGGLVKKPDRAAVLIPPQFRKETNASHQLADHICAGCRLNEKRRPTANGKPRTI